MTGTDLRICCALRRSSAPPKAHEVLVKVQAAAVTRADCAIRDANRNSGLFVSIISRLISGPRRPRQPILGSEFAGTIAGLGEDAHEFTLGDAVFGSTARRGAESNKLVHQFRVQLMIEAQDIRDALRQAGSLGPFQIVSITRET